MVLGERSGGEELGRVEGEETVARRIHYVREESIFNEKRKKKLSNIHNVLK